MREVNSKNMNIKSLFFPVVLLVALALPAAAFDLQRLTLTALTLPGDCTPPASAGCDATTQPITAFGAIEPTIAGGSMPGWTGTWSTPVAPAWQGTFTTSGGAYPSSPIGASTTVWNFAGLASSFLPTGTFVNFGDLDDGSGQTEEYELTAKDSSGNVITTPWLDSPFFVSSAVNCETECVQAAMPEYVWGARQVVRHVE
jgi:hypothetical protein